MGLVVGCTAPEWDTRRPEYGTWAVRVPAVAWWGFNAPLTGSSSRSQTVPTLSDLDPADPTLLPDGSRQVDAIALARVALHLGGAR